MLVFLNCYDLSTHLPCRDFLAHVSTTSRMGLLNLRAYSTFSLRHVVGHAIRIARKCRNIFRKLVALASLKVPSGCHFCDGASQLAFNPTNIDMKTLLEQPRSRPTTPPPTMANYSIPLVSPPMVCAPPSDTNIGWELEFFSFHTHKKHTSYRQTLARKKTLTSFMKKKYYVSPTNIASVHFNDGLS